MRPQTEFRSIGEISNPPIVLKGGMSVPLSAIADVRLEVADPPVETAWMDGRQVVAVAVVPTDRADPPTLGDLLATAGDDLARHKRPRRMALVDEIPRTPATGQIRRRDLIPLLN